jgi:tRNA-splicing ligase RtcB
VHTVSRMEDVVTEFPVESQAGMHVPARVVADAALLGAMRQDRSLAQLLNVATLPGTWGAVVGMPDMHEGYGFPVGGVAATLLPDGAISPGGIGFDINCGVRLLASPLRLSDVEALLEPFIHELSRSIPTGFGRQGRLSLSPSELDGVLSEGSRWVVRARGMGHEADLEATESGGCLGEADPAAVSARARERGRDQLGTLGGGNHFLEVQQVECVEDAHAAEAFGLFEGQLVVLLHTGSRGLGHQVCTDAVREMDAWLLRAGVTLVDRQLAYAPLSSPEGRAYLAAMSAAANFAWANRQVLTHRVREVADRVLGAGRARLKVVYDVAHNIAKIERHGGRELCVHRKGATRAFGPRSPELPHAYSEVGQPVFIPGSMGTGSWVLAGNGDPAVRTFASCCHGAGRTLSRHAAKAQVAGPALRRDLEARGIHVRCPSNAELAEEAPAAYKDVDRVVEVVAAAGIARKVARLRPRAVLKG